MALKFRRGTTAQKSGSLAFGEPYVNTTEGALQVGLESGDITIRSIDSTTALVVTSVSASSFVSASSLNVSGNATIGGNLTLGGNITIGDATTDTVTVTANLSSSLIPSVTNVFDLGSADKIWRDLYLSTGSIKLVNGSGTVVNTITNANIVTTDSIASGSVTLTNSLPAGIVSGSSQITLQSTTGFSAFDTALKTITGSLISSASTAKTTNDSQDVSITNLNTFSGSQLTQNTALATITGSLISSASADIVSITNINTFSGSQLTQNTALATITGSLISSASSFETRNASLATITGSLISTASTNTQRLTAMEAVSGSWITEAETSSFVRTDTTNVFTTNQIISGGLDVTGTITANEFHTTYVSSSVMYNSGSNRFGDSVDDLQQLIGIVEITGSIKGTQFNNLATITGSLIITASNHTQTLLGLSSETSSYARINQSNTFANSQIISGNVDVDGKITAKFAVSASSININNASGTSQLELVNSTNGRGFHLISYDGDSFSIHNPTTGQSTFRIDSGSQYHSHFFGDVSVLSGSVSSSIGFSGSINGIGNVTIFSSSVDTRITNVSSSLDTLSGSTYTMSSSLDTRITNVSSSLDSLSGSTYSVSSSLDTRIVNVSSSLDTLSGSTYSVSSSLDTRVINVSSSLYDLSGSTYSVSSSLDTRVTNVSSSLYDLSGSTYSVSSSLDTRITNNSSSIASLNTYTSSLNNAIQLTGSTVSFLGDIVVYGTQSIINSTNLAVNDNLIYLNEGSTVTNPDLGIVGNYNNGAYAHGGIFRDASDGGAWKVFEGYTLEPSGTIDTTGNGFTLADFKADVITGTTLIGSIAATNGIYSSSAQIQGNIYSAGSSVTIQDIVIGAGTTFGKITTDGSKYISVMPTYNTESARFWANGNVTIQDAGTYVDNGYRLEVSGSTRIIGNTTITGSFNVSGGVTGSIAATNGVISGSSQIDLTATTNYASGILTRLNAVGVFSGSAQVSGLSNAQLSNSTISGKALGTNLDTLTIGTGLSGTSYNGSSAVTIANTGVISNIAGTGISVSAATGNVTITNTGVTSISAGTGVGVSAGTGAVTVSIGQAVATSSSPTFAGLTINGAITATGDITAYYTSDRRHKNNIQPIPNALQKVSKLNGVTWEWNDDVHEVTKSTPKTGLIAQEVQLVLPEVVTERADGFLALDYSKMMGLMVEAIKEQQIKIDNLTAKVEELKRQRGL